MQRDFTAAVFGAKHFYRVIHRYQQRRRRGALPSRVFKGRPKNKFPISTAGDPLRL
jgi:hypothetical protein